MMHKLLGLLFITTTLLSLTGIISAQPAASGTEDKNAVGLWKFVGGSGPTVPDLVGKNPGKIVGCTWQDGKAGTMLTFNGEGDHVDCGSGGSDQIASAITVEVTFRLNGLNFEGHPWRSIVDQHQLGDKGYYVQFYLGQLACGIATETGWHKIELGQPDFASQVYDRDWHTARMIYDGKTLTLWYDDSLVGSQKVTGSFQPGNSNLWIGGCSVASGRCFQGDIAQVRLSNIARPDLLGSLGYAPERDTLAIKSDGKSKCSIKETCEAIVVSNGIMEWTFDKRRGGVLSDIKDIKNASVTFHTADEDLSGQWNIDMLNDGAIASSGTRYLSGEYTSGSGESVLKICCSAQGGKLWQIYTLKDSGRDLKCQAEYRNDRKTKVMIGRYGFTLANLSIGGSLKNNRFIYPPTFFHFMKGDMSSAADEAAMGRKYIYGLFQPTDMMQLPYAMVYNDNAKQYVTLAAVNSRTKAWVGVQCSTSGRVRTAFDLYANVNPGKSQELGAAYLSLYNKDWPSSMSAERDLLMREAAYGAPKRRPDFVNDLVILWDGFPGAGFETFDGLANLLPRYKELGINAVIIGGRTWQCYFDRDPKSGVAGFIPIPRSGRIVPSETTGGEAGLRRLVAKAHSLGIKLFAWGPTSLAGIDNHSGEAATRPDWWIYGKDGQLSRWYPFMLPPDSNCAGWQDFCTSNVSRVIQDYDIDGVWLDSSYQAHGLNYKAADGWYGGPNGAKIGLIAKIVEAAKKANPNAVVMSESSGAEIMSRVDINYLHCHGIWPVIKPEELQTFIKMEELNRIPGMRPFGQIELGKGFYAELGDKPSRELAEKYKDSWMAKTFLVSTLNRVPVYFGFNWPLGALLNEGKNAPAAKGTENNPERLKADGEKEKFRKWLATFKTINRVRSENAEIRRGDTAFDRVEVSSPSVVHFVKTLPGKESIILLNADNAVRTVTARISVPQAFGLSADKKYAIRNLMTGELVRHPSSKTFWSGSEISGSGFALTLDEYQGAVLKIVPAK
jgi:hypothetical protein